MDYAWLLRSKDEMQAQRYTGKAKRPCYSYPKAMVAGDYLYISYATNKEDVEYSRVPLISVQLVAAIEQVTTDPAPNAYYYDLTGRRQLHPTADLCCDWVSSIIGKTSEHSNMKSMAWEINSSPIVWHRLSRLRCSSIDRTVLCFPMIKKVVYLLGIFLIFVLSIGQIE